MHELLTTAEMAEADRATIAGGTAGLTLMRSAGGAVAEAVGRMVRLPARVLIFCGPGNNGGDGFVAASRLRAAGSRVRVVMAGDRAGLRGDAAAAAAEWGEEVEPFGDDMLAECEIVVDALFGAGLERPLAGEAASIVAAVNGSGRPVLAVDVPSGVDGTTGRTVGPAVRATRTVTFFRRKPGHLLMPGRLLCGQVELAQIGIAPEVLRSIGPKAHANEPSLWQASLSWPAVDGHKYSRGHVLVVGGAGPRSGAPRLSANAALRIGAGLVTVAAPYRALAVYASQLTAVMVKEADGARGLARLLEDGRLNAVLLGPGLGAGAETAARVETALAAGRAVVLDADALTSFAGQAERLFAAIGGAAGPGVVLTPHEGEFARLFGEALMREAASKLEAARQAARRSGAVVVLKGGDTVVAAPDGRAAVNATTSPYLATAGTGDVLAGLVAGLLAQGVPSFEAAAAAVWMHGAAARRLGPGLISEDLQGAIPAVLAELAPAW